MKQTIYKYPLNTTGETTIVVRGQNAKVLSVGEQDGGIVAWIQFHPHESIVSSVIIDGYGTGGFGRPLLRRWRHDDPDGTTSTDKTDGIDGRLPSKIE